MIRMLKQMVIVITILVRVSALGILIVLLVRSGSTWVEIMRNDIRFLVIDCGLGKEGREETEVETRKGVARESWRYTIPYMIYWCTLAFKGVSIAYIYT